MVVIFHEDEAGGKLKPDGANAIEYSERNIFKSTNSITALFNENKKNK